MLGQESLAAIAPYLRERAAVFGERQMDAVQIL